MKRIKRMFAKFLWNRPVLKGLLCFLAFLLALFSVLVMFVALDGDYPKLTLISIVFIFFFAVIFVMLELSKAWTNDLPEYVILQGRKILEKNSGFEELDTLIKAGEMSLLISNVKERLEQSAKWTKKLQNWIEKYERHNIFVRHLSELEKEEKDLISRVVALHEKVKELKKELGI